MRKLFSLTILFAIGITPLFARDVEILVEDIELGLPLEGAVIRSWDGVQYVCDKEGKAVISVPDDRQVIIQGAYPGYDNGRLVITPGASAFTLGLRLSGIMENRELVIEAERPGTNETRTGRSVAISGRDIAQTAEIGIIEDVINSIKLLPGVGYAGLFNAQPSIRGGEPGDMRASLDGFYIFNPYHWSGAFSIFDPRMVESAQLSHGVFSTRYGHTISGLLDITSKKPSSTETEFELGLNTSAANFNVSLPFAGRGGVMLMGRVTYYDPVIWLAQQMSNSIDALALVNAIRVAPYIRSTTITGNYRFLDNLDFHATGFLGIDGTGVEYGPQTTGGLSGRTEILLDYVNYQAFFTAGLSWNPRNDMLVKFSAGAGYMDEVIDGYTSNSIGARAYSENFRTKYPDLELPETYNFFTRSLIESSESSFNAQGRVDYDWELGNGFLFAAGVQEMFAKYQSTGEQQSFIDLRYLNLDSDARQKIKDALTLAGYSIPDDSRVWYDLIISTPVTYSPDARNNLITTSGYGLIEYTTPNNRLNAELGLRVDHFILSSNGYTLQSKPALNPRLNVDFNVFKNTGFMESFDISAGTGLFSSISDNVFFAEEQYNISEIKPSRAWTSVLGTRLKFPGGLSFNIEGYYKYVYDRMYIPIDVGLDNFEARPQFNGEGHVWGFDLMLQKIQSRFWDGWVSYSYNWTKYRDPGAGNANLGISGGVRGEDWYFPSYHRFHNLNLVLNVKPTPRINIYTRFGMASGVQIVERSGDGPVSYPVFVVDPGNPSNGTFLEKYYWPSQLNGNNRTGFSFPMDIKFSIFGKNNNRKARYEVYVAIENVLALLYSAEGNTTFNQYTGEVDEGSTSASYEIPIPIPSFGVKISY